MARKFEEPQERGDFLKSLGTLFAGFVASRVEDALTGLGPKLLRPPGALDEFAFLTACTRCDKCIRACPENALRKAAANQGLALNTPYLLPRAVPCFLCTALPCVAACEDGALVWPERTLADGTRLEGPRAVRIGTAKVNPRRCLTYDADLREAQACRVCVDRCPYPEAAIRIGEPPEGEALGHPEVREDVCTGCGICVFACPTPEPAIVVEPRRG